MGSIVKKVAKTVNKLDPLGKVADKGLNALGLPTATDIGNMLDPEKPDLPGAPATTPQEQSDQAAQQAALAANAKAAELARQRRAGSVLSGGAPAGTGQVSSVLAYGKSRLGD